MQHLRNPLPPWARLLTLAACCFAIWLFLWVLTPIIVSHSPNLARYGDVALENNIQPGALYYTDVPVSAEAERHNRDTVRFLPKGPRPQGSLTGP